MTDPTQAAQRLRPHRIQRKRTKGFKLPPATVCVTRPGKFGNPFETAEKFRTILSQIVDGGTSEHLACNFNEFAHMIYIAQTLYELRGKNLACFCSLDKPCHADVLLEFANR